ncbi:hypothetical protein PQ455_18535 [Sphingomonas naphthae]|uniref:Phasin family protein n=1 Tax=Sphingomonas naphthae TaxID=1813468 RepID=A0ABY7TK23_9SPHN|nr:hypothetical protein [Sphingomonas naphthae]WCT73578.1 hypothetical protein PQ455_18535 [Sphingomonas naphthae]
MADEKLPEGTDTVINGASGSSDASSATGAAFDGDAKTAPGFDWTSAEGFRSAFGAKAQGFFDTAGDRAKDYVTEGLDRGVTALDDVVRMVDDAATTIDEKVGAQYGDYARKASSAISGFAETLRMKDAETLFADARHAVKKSPAIAIGAAAALGFVVARIIKAGMPDAPEPTSKAPTLAEDDPIVPAA